MTVYQIETAEAGYRDYSIDRVADNQARRIAATGWRPSTVCGLGQFDCEATADMVIRDCLHNYAPIAHAGEIHPDKLVLRVVAVEIAFAPASADDYGRARRAWIDSDSGITKLSAAAQLSPLEFDIMRSRGIEDRG